MFKTDKDGHEEEVHPLHNWRPGLWAFTLIFLLAMGLYYLYYIDKAWTNRMLPVKVWPEEVVKDLETKPAKKVEGIELSLITNPSDELIKKGKEIYNGVCATCHGAGGKGDGPGGAMLNPKPRDFTDAEGWTNDASLTGMYKTLQEGISGTGMVAYEYYPESEKFALIHYIRTFADHYPEITEEAVKTLDDEYALTSGKTIPPQIPSAKASAILIKENTALSDLQKDILFQIKEDGKSGKFGAKLFLKSVSCPRKAVKSLLSKKIWKKSQVDFLVFLRGGLPDNGFKTDVLAAKKEEFSSFHTYLINIFTFGSETLVQ